MLRKQNSTFAVSFISEAGEKLENNDYFAYVELEQYACYVIADGLNDLQSSQSASLATKAVILAFQERPSIKKRAVLSYLKAANKALTEEKGREHLKASITVVVSDYAKIRYAHAGNTRLRLYRHGIVREESEDMSLGRELGKERQLADDVLARHEERNNLYSYLGQGKHFSPFISKKITLENDDIIALYTRGIWENVDNGELDDVFSEAKEEPQESLDNVEELLLSRQPEHLENYTFAAIFVNKVFLDPNRKRRLKKILTVSLIILLLAVIAGAVIWLLHRQRQNRMEDMERKYQDTVAYIDDGNYVRAGETCGEALELAEKLRDRDMIREISGYQKLIEAVNRADDFYAEGEYEEAQEGYRTAKEHSRHADHAADDYIDKKLESITDYLNVFDYIQLGDSQYLKGDYESAETKYLEAKRLATGIHYEEGRRQAMDALDRLYDDLAARQEEEAAKVQETVTAQTGAAELTGQGDRAFEDGDYEGAKVYYAMALDQYRKLDDAVNMGMVETKLNACVKKSGEKDEQKELAEEYVEAAKELEEEGDLAGAEKQYMMAKEIYEGIGEEEKAAQMTNRIDMLELDREEEKEKAEEERKEGGTAGEGNGETVSGNSSG